MGKKTGVVVAAGVLAVMTVISGVMATIFMALSVVHPHQFVDDMITCSYKPSPAFLFGAVAAVTALITQILSSTAIGSCGPWRNVQGKPRRAIALLSFVASWFLAVSVMTQFMAGVAFGTGVVYSPIVEESDRCIAPGVVIFVAATISFLFVVALEITSYILIQKA